MPYFPYPNVTDGFQDLLTYGNIVSGNVFGVSILLGFFFILFISLKTRGFPTEKVFASAVFSTTTLSYIMVLIPNFISPEIVVTMTMVTAISVLFLYKTGSGGESY